MAPSAIFTHRFTTYPEEAVGTHTRPYNRFTTYPEEAVGTHTRPYNIHIIKLRFHKVHVGMNKYKIKYHVELTTGIKNVFKKTSKICIQQAMLYDNEGEQANCCDDNIPCW